MTTRPLRLTRATCGLMTALLVAGCAESPHRESRMLQVAIALPIATFAPAANLRFEGRSFTGLGYEALTRVGRQGRIEPLLARSWSSADAQHWRFQLRTGARFHDGTRFTADRVRLAWQAALAEPPGSPRHPTVLDMLDGALAFSRKERADIPGLTVVNDSTLELTLTSPFGGLPAALSVSTLAVTGPGASDSVVNGTGPWRLAAGRPMATDFTWVRNAEYWGDKPRLDSLRIRVIAPERMSHSLDSGSVDCMPLADEHPAFAMRTDFRLTRSAPLALLQATLNVRHPLLREQAGREAISLAIDRAVLARAVGSTAPTFRASALPPGLVPWDTVPLPVPHDVARAAATLAALHADHAPPLRIFSLPGDSADPMLASFRAQLAAVGVRTRLVSLSLDRVSSSLQDSVDIQFGRFLHPYPDADALLFRLFHSRAAGGLATTFGFADTTIDRALDRERALTFGPARDSALVALGRSVFAAQPTLVLWFDGVLTAASTRVTGCPSSLWPSRYEDVDLARR